MRTTRALVAGAAAALAVGLIAPTAWSEPGSTPGDSGNGTNISGFSDTDDGRGGPSGGGQDGRSGGDGQGSRDGQGGQGSRDGQGDQSQGGQGDQGSRDDQGDQSEGDGGGGQGGDATDRCDDERDSEVPTRSRALTPVGGVRGGLGGGSSTGATPTDMAIGGTLVAGALVGGGVFWTRRRQDSKG